MLAFKKAVEAGCDGIELDVQLTRDDKLVIIHDEEIDRTSNGKGFVKDMTYEEICAFDFSYTHMGQVERQQLPLLDEYFSYIREFDVVTNIELKNGRFDHPQLEKKVYDLILKYDLKDKVIISSFNHVSVLRMKQIDASIPCGLLEESRLLNPAAYVQDSGVEFYHPYYAVVDSDVMREFTAKGIELNVWTVNTEEDIRQMAELGVHAVIGNYPDRVKDLLETL